MTGGDACLAARARVQVDAKTVLLARRRLGQRDEVFVDARIGNVVGGMTLRKPLDRRKRLLLLEHIENAQPDRGCSHCTFKMRNRDLIVKAKRWDGSQQQDFDQWALEIKARPLEHSIQRLLLLAIGGLPEYDVRHVFTLKRKALESEAFTQRGLQDADFDLLAASWGPVTLGDADPLAGLSFSSLV